MRFRSQDRLEEAFDRELRILAHIPTLRDKFQRLDLLTDLFIVTAENRYLKERDAVIREIDESLLGIEGLARRDPQAKASIDELRRQFQALTLEQRHWVQKRQTAELGPGALSLMVGRLRDLRKVLDAVAGLSFFSIQRLRERRREARGAARASFWTLTAALAALCAVLFGYFSRRVVHPLTVLSRRARRWRIGYRWIKSFPRSDEEIGTLQRHISAMSERANRAYAKEAELVQFKSRMASMVSHEFNNSLSIIQGVVSLLDGDLGAIPEKKRREYHAIILANVKSLASESATILHMGRIEEGKFKLRLSPVDVGALVESAASRLKILCDRKGHTLAVDIRDGLPEAKADADTLSLVVGNLITNAIKYTPKGGRIEIRAYADGPRIRLSVKDDGIGISPDDQEKIFSGYYRTEESKREARGFGLGLAFARKVLEEHGHRLELESEPSRGSTFSFALDPWEGKADEAA